MTDRPSSDRPRFHLAFPVDDLAAARRFYGEVLGCPEGRSADHWVDFDLYGHQIVAHLVDARGERATNPVDGDDVPVPHFGLLRPDDWRVLPDRLIAKGVQEELVDVATASMAAINNAYNQIMKRAAA